MVHQTDAESLASAWRALSEHEEGTGWSTIEVSRLGSVRILAARHFPGNQEAILAGFSAVTPPGPRDLPSGRGFAVEKPDLGTEGAGLSWISLERHPHGNLELFTLMAVDVLSTLNSLRGGSEAAFLRVLLARVHAWQDFMEREKETTLGREAEVGLLGELITLRDLIRAGVPAVAALDAWQGPLDGLQDFALGTGGIEVKSTSATVGFEAFIHSLEQLDETLRAPLFLSCVRLPLEEKGFSLPDFIEALQESLVADTIALSLLGSRLLHAGYLPSGSAHYTRRFREGGCRLLEVTHDFPGLTRRNVPSRIRRASYTVDLDGFGEPGMPLDSALLRLGVLR